MITIASLVIVNPCAGLSASDPMYWVLGCWYLPSFVPPVLATGAAIGAALRVRMGR